MSKKAKIIKIIALCIQIIPILVVFGIYCPALVSRWDKALSASSIILLIILMLIFKDSLGKFIGKHSALVFSIFTLILCLIQASIGSELLILSATSVISTLVALPLNVWFNVITKPVNNYDLSKQIDRLVKNDEKNKNKS